MNTILGVIGPGFLIRFLIAGFFEPPPHDQYCYSRKTLGLSGSSGTMRRMEGLVFFLAFHECGSLGVLQAQ